MERIEGLMRRNHGAEKGRKPERGYGEGEGPRGTRRARMGQGLGEEVGTRWRDRGLDGVGKREGPAVYSWGGAWSLHTGEERGRRGVGEVIAWWGGKLRGTRTDGRPGDEQGRLWGSGEAVVRGGRGVEGAAEREEGPGAGDQQRAEA